MACRVLAIDGVMIEQGEKKSLRPMGFRCGLQTTGAVLYHS